MSNEKNPTLGQARHTLTIIDQQSPSAEDLRTLHDGYLADVVKAIKAGSVPPRDSFQKMLGLPVLWKTIVIPSYTSGKDCLEELNSANVKMSKMVRDRIGAFTFYSSSITRVDLAKISVQEMGLESVSLGLAEALIYAKRFDLRRPFDQGIGQLCLELATEELTDKVLWLVDTRPEKGCIISAISRDQSSGQIELNMHWHTGGKLPSNVEFVWMM